MGCRVSSHESNQNIPTISENTVETMPRHNTHDEVDYKSRLERKICLAKETPEPDYDLSDCNLRDIPSGVYIMCRILLKEQLNLSNNKLHNLTSGGNSLRDLALIKYINISGNRFKKLPNDIHCLENLREFNLSHNLLETLPAAIKDLKHLELLDVSGNNLNNLDQITLLPSLKILNVAGNNKLIKLPYTLTTCQSLIDIVLDADNFIFPPPDVTNRGTLEILNFLMQNADDANQNYAIRDITERFIAIEKTERHHVERKKDKHEKDKYTIQTLLDHERAAQEKDYLLEAQLHEQQQKKKQMLLEQLLIEQNQSDNMVFNLQKEKQVERDRLISSILQDEEYSNMIVGNLITLKNGPDPGLLEREKQEQDDLLERLRIQQSDLRRQEIVSAMMNLLENEMTVINSYQAQRDHESRNILMQENETNQMLENVFIEYDKNRSGFIDEIRQNEELQKSAVAALIVKNDARTWGLVEQVRIVEAQLAKMTFFEIEKRKMTSEGTIDELAESRLNLTMILLELLDQQEKRRLQLYETLRYIEEQNEENRKDYWLLQYQRLIDSHPTEMSVHSTSIDPLLGFSFLLNGVVHCLPFLSKIWQTMENRLDEITDADLICAGIKNENDRQNILKSITEFMSQCNKLGQDSLSFSRGAECLPSCSENVTIAEEAMESEPDIVQKETNVAPRQLTECVICMENDSQVIFLPCGHLCCCNDCQINLHECPICRGKLERRIKVIRP